MPSAVKGSSKVLLSATLSVLLGIGVVVGVGYTLNGASDDGRDPVVATMAGNIDTPKGNMPHATATLSVYADAESSEGAHGPDGGGHPGYVTYGPSNHLILPANSLITITIKGYDGGESLNTPFFGKVIGTVDGSMDVDGKKSYSTWNERGATHFHNPRSTNIYPRSIICKYSTFQTT